MLSKMWDEVTYYFRNFNDATVAVWGWKSNLIPHIMIDVITYKSMLELKLIHVSKRGPREQAGITLFDLDFLYCVHCFVIYFLCRSLDSGREYYLHVKLETLSLWRYDQI